MNPAVELAGSPMDHPHIAAFRKGFDNSHDCAAL
jgi:hypothetical protein